MQQPCSSEWRLWEQIGVGHPDERKIVISHMPEGGAACLRQVSRGMQRTVNSSVEAMVCKLGAQLPLSELAGTCADAVISCWCTYPVTSVPDHPPTSMTAQSAAAVSTFLGLLCASCAQPLEKIRDLEVSRAPELRPDSIAACTAEFLAR
jgi:hypothetical protein